jgi:Zn-dependent protease
VSVCYDPWFLGGRLPDIDPAFAVSWYCILLFSLSVHESAHAWTALQMGDDTAAREGRITLNPLPHIDPVGTILMPLLQIVAGGIPLLAWAKPTPVAGHNLRRLARGHILVAGAGPTSNLLLAVLVTAILMVAVRLGWSPDSRSALLNLAGTAVAMNVGLAIFNLVPIPPLDGSWIASWGLPRPMAAHYDRVMEPYGFIILMVLMVTGALSYITSPFNRLITGFLFSLVF